MLPVKKITLIVLVWVFASSNILRIFSNNPSLRTSPLANDVAATNNVAAISENEITYDSLRLQEKGLSHDIFELAAKGYEALKEQGKLQNDSILTVVDFDQPSYNKRMYVINMKRRKLLFNTWSAHGRNTGAALATKFSNRLKSHQSSLGFYLTKDPYNGGNGYSLRLIGLEPCNNKAWERAIVLHGAPYVSEQWIKNTGYIGRSWGCPAVPDELSKPIINTIKGGSCLFIYHKTYRPSKKYGLS